MKKILFFLCTIAISSTASANSKVTYLSCPKLDDRASDLIVVLDPSNATASLQSPSSGSGLNFTSNAAFGPTEVTWRKDSPRLKQTYSVDRGSLVLKRKTFSEMTGSTDINSSECSIINPKRNNKF